MKYRICLLLCAHVLLAKGQNDTHAYLTDETHYREHPIDMTHMKLDIRLDTKQGTVAASVTHRFTVLQQNVDSIFFDAPGIHILSAQLNHKKLAYSTEAKGIWVKPSHTLHAGEEATISLEYTAKPPKGIYFIGWNAPENKEHNPFAVRQQIWTQGQGIDNRYWIPMYDDMNDKLITETIIHFDEDYEVLSNGDLKSKTQNEDHTLTWHYAMSEPQAPYLIMLGIGKYGIQKRQSKSGVPLFCYYYPEFKERLAPTYRHTEALVDFVAQETGIPYPWSSYAQIMVQDFMYGAMENTTATIFGDFFNVDERAAVDRDYIGVNCHELTHQWFGDCLTARDSRDAWLQESFATYYPKLYTRQYLGEAEYDWQRRTEQNTALAASKQDHKPIRHSQAGSSRIYQKGSTVLGMLSHILGKEQWQRALRRYFKTHAYGNVATIDLQQAIQDELGIDMEWFFDEWVLRGGEPEYTIHYDAVRQSSGKMATKIYIEQSHQQDQWVGLFRMPIKIEIHYTDGSSDSSTQWIEQANEQLTIANPNNKKIAFVLFDPNSQVLKTLHFPKGFEELKAQALGATHLLDRYDAVLEMRGLPLAQKRSTLLQLLRQESFHQMKAELVQQLINDESAAAVLQTVFAEKAPSPKLAAIRAYKGKSPTWRAVFEQALTDQSYEVVQTALERLCSQYPEDAALFLARCEGVYGMNNSVHIKYLMLKAIYTEDKRASLDRLVYYASDAWEFRTRSNAFEALKALGHCNDSLIGSLYQAAMSKNTRLARPAIALISHFAQETLLKNRFKQYYQQHDWTEEEQAQLKNAAVFLD